MSKGNLFVISGPSGAGKGTICSAFLQNHPEVYLSISATTRKPREGEREGVNYYFVTEEYFRAEIERGGFLEYAAYCGNYYGTPKQKVLEQLEAGRDVILEIESNGAMQVRSHYPEGVFVFVCPPSPKILRERLVGRGTEAPEVIEARLKKSEQEFALAGKYNYILINDCVDDAVKRLEAIVAAEKCYMPRNIDFVKNFIK